MQRKGSIQRPWTMKSMHHKRTKEPRRTDSKRELCEMHLARARNQAQMQGWRGGISKLQTKEGKNQVNVIKRSF